MIPEPLTTFILLKMQSTVNYDKLLWFFWNIYMDPKNTFLKDTSANTTMWCQDTFHGM